MNLTMLQDRLWRLGCSDAERTTACEQARKQLRTEGRFAVEAPGGWVLGRMTDHGVVMGTGRYREASNG